jgi:DNA-binding FadR family transcriptional regulator
MASSADPTDPEQRRRWSDADRAFHRQIAVSTANPVLLAVADHLAALMDQPLWQQLRDDSIAVPGRTTLQLAEHRLIAAAITEGDPEAARRRAAEHIDRARRYMALD